MQLNHCKLSTVHALGLCTTYVDGPLTNCSFYIISIVEWSLRLKPATHRRRSAVSARQTALAVWASPSEIMGSSFWRCAGGVRWA